MNYKDLKQHRYTISGQKHTITRQICWKNTRKTVCKKWKKQKTAKNHLLKEHYLPKNASLRVEVSDGSVVIDGATRLRATMQVGGGVTRAPNQNNDRLQTCIQKNRKGRTQKRGRTKSSVPDRFTEGQINFIPQSLVNFIFVALSVI